KSAKSGVHFSGRILPDFIESGSNNPTAQTLPTTKPLYQPGANLLPVNRQRIVPSRHSGTKFGPGYWTIVTYVETRSMYSPVRVQILAGHFLDIRRFQLVAAAKHPLQRRPANQILQRALIKRVAFARLPEIHFRHQVRLTVDLHLQSLLKIARPVRSHGVGPY